MEFDQGEMEDELSGDEFDELPADVDYLENMTNITSDGCTQSKISNGEPATKRARPHDRVDFSSFAISSSIEADSHNGFLDIQVVDIECQQRTRIPEMDDPGVLEYLQTSMAYESDFNSSRWGTPSLSLNDIGRFNKWNVPCIRMFGKLRNGRSVCVNAYGYYPIVHLLIFNTFPTQTVIDDVVDVVESLLAKHDAIKRKDKPRPKGFKYVLYASRRTGFTVHPYIPNTYEFIELKLALPEFVKVFGDGMLRAKELHLPNSGLTVPVRPYSCINTVEQFQADMRISGFGWIRMPQSSTELADIEIGDTARCDLEINVNYAKISPIQHDDSIAPLRKITFDIECAKTLGMPKPQVNEVILIACICGEYENGQSVRKRRVILQYGTSGKIPHQIDPTRGDMHIHFTGPNAELEMMDAFGDLVRTFDPDFLAGHNMINFDLPYVVERANVLGCSQNALFLGRRGAWMWFPPRRFLKKRKNGETREATTTDTPGRIQLDTLTWIQGIRKLRSYKLGALGDHYLGETKMDVSYTMIVPLWKRSDETRARLAAYCMQDTILTEGLIDHKEFNMVMSAVEMSRQTRVPAPRLLKSGMQARVWGVLLEKSKSPNWDKENHASYFPYEIPKQRDKDDKFAGAEVLEPSRGFYGKKWVVCADFRSLYPSIIMLLNICFSTVITNPEYLTLPHSTSPSGTHFVSKSVRIGLLAQIEDELMNARDEAKRQKALSTDPARAKMYDSRQNEIKTICNSVYGILSASGGRFVRVELGLAVTSQGRAMIMAAKETAETFEEVEEVIYGDTDSVFVLLRDEMSAEDAFKILVRICDNATAKFASTDGDTKGSPVLLQAEKIMHLQLINKKRYIGSKILATKIERDKTTGEVTKVELKKPELITMGVEIARRDNCLLVKETMESIVTKIMLENDIAGARAVLDGVLRELLGGRTDIGKLVITRAITKDDYKVAPIHLLLAQRMAKRDPSYEFGPAERIPYVIVKQEHSKIADQAEDPLWAISHDLPIDEKYYIEHQLKAPIARTFMWLYVNEGEKYEIRVLEKKLREIHNIEDQEDLEKELRKKLVKKLDDVAKRVGDMLCGDQALAAHPRKRESSGGKGISTFFKPQARCSRCSKSVVFANALCRDCQPGSARCMWSNCKNMVNTPQDHYCSECTPHISQCISCSRTTYLIDDGICMSCFDGKCYSCGEAGLKTENGVCQKCKRFVSLRKAGMSAASVVDIEDLKKQAEEAKQECITKCGYATDDVECVSRDCSTLYRRATLASRIRNFKL